MSNALPLKREAAGPAATPASKRPRDCNSSDCSSSSSCGLKGTDAAVDTSDYECSICLSLLVDPVVGQCGHDFCKSCLDEWRDRTNSGGRAGVSCPVCRQVVMAPGVQSLGVCVRLQRMVEQRFPQQLKERRAEVAAVVVERTAAKQAEVQQQAAGVQDIMRARFARVAHIMGPHQGFAAAPLNPLTGTTYASSIPAPVLAVPSQPAIPVAMWTCASSQQAAAGPSSSAPRPTSSWHRPAADAGLRQSTIQALVSVFASRRPDMSEAFRRRLPNLVRKLEEVLYRTASSREEYADQNRLQSRVQAIVRQLTESRIQQRPGMVAAAAAASHMAAATVAPMVWGPVLAPVIAVGLPVHHVLQGSIAM